MAVRIAANLSMLFDTHSSGRMGSPSVAGSRRRFNAGTRPGSLAATAFGDDEADARIEFAWMPFHLGDDAARLRPASRLIGEVRIGAPDIKRGATDRTLEQIPACKRERAASAAPILP
jgi:hypothetical protein